MPLLSVQRWTLEGRINGVSVDVVGSGVADLATGHSEITLCTRSALPAGFDLLAAQMICNVAMTGYVAAGDTPLNEISPTGIRVAPRRHGRVYDEGGAEILSIGAVTTLTRDADGICVDNLVEGFAHLPEVRDVIAAEEILVPHAGARVTGLAQFQVVTDAGVLYGTTLSPYVLDGTQALPTMLRRAVTVRRIVETPTEIQLAIDSAWTRAAVVA